MISWVDTDIHLHQKCCHLSSKWNGNAFLGHGYWSIFHINQPKTIFLVRLCCSQHETDEEVIPSRQTNSLVINQTLLMPHQDEPNSLVINQRVWFVLFVVNQFHRHIWLLGLSCLLSTNFTVIFGCLVCLVCYQPISIIVIWMPPISWCILLSPSSPPHHHCCPMVVNSCQSMLQSIVVKFLHGYLLLAWSPILICCSHTQVSNRKQGMQIPFCNFPMQVPMHISNANFLCNFQCKFPMQFPMQISNAIPNANFQCKFPM